MKKRSFIKYTHITLTFITTFLLTGCVQFGASTASFFASFKGQESITDIAYGNEGRQKLDVYLPSEEFGARKDLPVIVFFYGGSWQYGSKDYYAFAAEPFTSKGYIVVIPDYAKYPNHRYPTFIEDGAKAVAWTHKNIAQYGGNNSKIFITGHSAGGHIAASLAIREEYLTRENVPKQSILGLVGLSGPYDFVPVARKIKAIFAPAGGDASSGMPATYIDGNEPPMLLIWGDSDTIVGKQNIDGMKRRVDRYGGDLDIKIYDGVGHFGTVTAFTLLFRDSNPLVEDMHSFFQNQLNKI